MHVPVILLIAHYVKGCFTSDYVLHVEVFVSKKRAEICVFTFQTDSQLFFYPQLPSTVSLLLGNRSLVECSTCNLLSELLQRTVYFECWLKQGRKIKQRDRSMFQTTCKLIYDTE